MTQRTTWNTVSTIKSTAYTCLFLPAELCLGLSDNGSDYSLHSGTRPITKELELMMYELTLTSRLSLLSNSKRGICCHFVVPQTEPPNIWDVLKQRLQPCVWGPKLCYTAHTQSIVNVCIIFRMSLSMQKCRDSASVSYSIRIQTCMLDACMCICLVFYCLQRFSLKESKDNAFNS